MLQLMTGQPADAPLAKPILSHGMGGLN